MLFSPMSDASGCLAVSATASGNGFAVPAVPDSGVVVRKEAAQKSVVGQIMEKVNNMTIEVNGVNVSAAGSNPCLAGLLYRRRTPRLRLSWRRH